ncbi:MAG: helix-turn-helix transcriptional regulator [Clostridia bacterium]|nr:helix-turn-helix transcriptional regulator [Clostridia bacterium]
MGKNFRTTLNEQLKNPEFKKEWDALEPEYQIIKAMLDTRGEKAMTQKQLADITGIPQADISRLENGNANPSLKTLQRLAAGMEMRLKLEFVPINR